MSYSIHCNIKQQIQVENNLYILLSYFLDNKIGYFFIHSGILI